MPEIDLIDILNDAESDFKHGIEQLIYTIKSIRNDVENFKNQTSKPDKPTAEALLEYIYMEECRAKKNMEIICGREIKQYFKWLDFYCEENDCTSEQALNQIIEGEI